MLEDMGKATVSSGFLIVVALIIRACAIWYELGLDALLRPTEICACVLGLAVSISLIVTGFKLSQ